MSRRVSHASPSSRSARQEIVEHSSPRRLYEHSYGEGSTRGAHMQIRGRGSGHRPHHSSGSLESRVGLEYKQHDFYQPERTFAERIGQRQPLPHPTLPSRQEDYRVRDLSQRIGVPYPAKSASFGDRVGTSGVQHSQIPYSRPLEERISPVPISKPLEERIYPTTPSHTLGKRMRIPSSVESLNSQKTNRQPRKPKYRKSNEKLETPKFHSPETKKSPPKMAPSGTSTPNSVGSIAELRERLLVTPSIVDRNKIYGNSPGTKAIVAEAKMFPVTPFHNQASSRSGSVKSMDVEMSDRHGCTLKTGISHPEDDVESDSSMDAEQIRGKDNETALFPGTNTLIALAEPDFLLQVSEGHQVHSGGKPVAGSDKVSNDMDLNSTLHTGSRVKRERQSSSNYDKGSREGNSDQSPNTTNPSVPAPIMANIFPDILKQREAVRVPESNPGAKPLTLGSEVNHSSSTHKAPATNVQHRGEWKAPTSDTDAGTVHVPSSNQDTCGMHSNSSQVLAEENIGDHSKRLQDRQDWFNISQGQGISTALDLTGTSRTHTTTSSKSETVNSKRSENYKARSPLEHEITQKTINGSDISRNFKNESDVNKGKNNKPLSSPIRTTPEAEILQASDKEMHHDTASNRRQETEMKFYEEPIPYVSDRLLRGSRAEASEPSRGYPDNRHERMMGLPGQAPIQIEVSQRTGWADGHDRFEFESHRRPEPTPYYARPVQFGHYDDYSRPIISSRSMEHLDYHQARDSALFGPYSSSRFELYEPRTRPEHQEPYSRDLHEWLAITGFYNLSYRNIRLREARAQQGFGAHSSRNETFPTAYSPLPIPSYAKPDFVSSSGNPRFASNSSSSFEMTSRHYSNRPALDGDGEASALYSGDVHGHEVNQANSSMTSKRPYPFNEDTVSRKAARSHPSLLHNSRSRQGNIEPLRERHDSIGKAAMPVEEPHQSAITSGGEMTKKSENLRVKSNWWNDQEEPTRTRESMGRHNLAEDRRYRDSRPSIDVRDVPKDERVISEITSTIKRLPTLNAGGHHNSSGRISPRLGRDLTAERTRPREYPRADNESRLDLETHRSRPLPNEASDREIKFHPDGGIVIARSEQTETQTSDTRVRPETSSKTDEAGHSGRELRSDTNSYRSSRRSYGDVRPVNDTASRMPDLAEARYFMVKSYTIDNVLRAQNENIWTTQQKNSEALRDAFMTSRDVFLLFSVNGSGHFHGYARMESIPGTAPLPAWSESLIWAPSGAFSIRWVAIAELAFRYVSCRNSLNEDQLAFVGRDGQEIEVKAGRELCGAIDRQEEREERVDASWGRRSRG